MEISESIIVKSSRLKSVVWNDFDRVKKGDTCVAICRHCKKRLSGLSTSGTSHLRNHLIRCRRRSNNDVAQLYATREKKKEAVVALPNYNFDQNQRKDEMLNVVNAKFEQDQVKDVISNIRNNVIDQKRSRFDLAQMIILHGYPLTMVEHHGFKIFVKNLQPLFDLVSVNGVEADCMEIYEKEKQNMYEVLDKLSGKISLGANILKASGDIHYLCLTSHYIDQAWELQKKILNFVILDPSHSEDMLSEIIMTCLMDWDIDRKLFSMSLDCCPTNDNIMCRIRDRLSQNRFLLCDGQLFDIRCAANLVNMMVQDALEALSETTHKIRESIRYVKSSQAMQEKFNEMAQRVRVESQKCLCLDNPLRWNLIYLMLEAALEHKEAFSLMQEHDPAYVICPSDTEWERAGAIAGYLKLFIEVTHVLTRSKYPTANIYFPEICDIHLHLIDLCNSSDIFVNSLARKMKSKFDEYWKKCNLALAIAAILDPRFKMKLVEYYYSKIYGSNATIHIDAISESMKALFNEHAICSPLASLDQGLSWQVGGNGRPTAGNYSRDRLVGFDKFLHETSQSQSVKSDLDKYLEEPLFPRNVDFNILNWWKVHAPKYPILSMMARNVLGIPMSKVALDSAFNIEGRVLDHERSSLSPATVQALVCAQDWMRNELEGSFSYFNL